MAKHRQTKACEIPPRVKEAVYERDGHVCVLCERWADPSNACAHFIPRKPHLGLGIEENILTLCQDCHDAYDKTTRRKEIQERLRQYLKSKYPDWDEAKLIYHKYA